jgi:hypothetical protein
MTVFLSPEVDCPYLHVFTYDTSAEIAIQAQKQYAAYSHGMGIGD